MITDDEVLDLFERADPARAGDPAPTLGAAAFLEGLRSTPSYVAEPEATRVELGPSPNRRWRVIAAVAAAGVLIVGALVLAADREPSGPTDDQAPATTEPTRRPTNPAAVRIATGFVAAIGAFDVDAAMADLAEDADISLVTAPGGVGDAGPATTRQDLPRLLALLEAQGYEQSADLCAVNSQAEDETIVRCALTFSSLRSGQFAWAPFGPSHIDVVVRRGRITGATTRWASERFEAEVWEPFTTWVAANHRADAEVMYPDGSRSSARLSESSIRLWGQRTREYAALQGAAMVEVAAEFMAARNAHDADAARALVADDGVLAQLCNQGLTPRYACVVDDPEEPIMGRVPLDRAGITFALDAEALYDLRFEDVACEKVSGPLVTCSYRMDNRLREIAGDAPVEAASSLGVVDGRVRLVAFPWLNIGFNPAGLNPVEAEPFVHWLEQEYPWAVGSGDLTSTNGPVFRAEGQELLLILTRPSLARLGGFLDDYEAAGGPLSVEADASRLHRRVAGLSFSLDTPAPWAPGPIEPLTDADGFRSRSL